DLYDCTTAGGSKVFAFKAGVKNAGTGDWGDKTEYHVHMHSIFEGIAGYDGVYVPKNTGVLLKCMDSDATNENTYYCIGEHNDEALPSETVSTDVTDNVMKGITVDAQPLTGSAENSIYVIQQGLFRLVPASTNLTMPIHKAYLQLNGVPAGANVRFTSLDDDANAIQIVNAEHSNSAIYNLQGMQVQTPQRGIYIKNGKKYIAR
ncbi:MAG: leucine-rich repeat domain-containing protein, partial [Prevotellaceae bacterium]|nr:leucine-rich repeat domain-containing protein [Candidatus Minthosoma caballi]